MNGYFGTKAQMRMQEKSDRLTPWIMDTPGACLTGRSISSDNPALLGWDVVHQHLQEDGMFSFRWVDAQGLTEIEAQVKPLGASIFRWDGYHADADTLREANADLLSRAIPAGFSVEVARGTALQTLQRHYATCGIMPLSTAVLGGENCRAMSVLIRDAGGAIAAAGFAGMLQNDHSPLRDWAWAGLIATADGYRQRGFGIHLTAELMHAAVDRLGASHVMAFAGPDNAPSKRMLEACGLTPTEHASFMASMTPDRPTR